MFEELKFAHSLGSDNHSGVHPKVMEALAHANRGHAHSYGLDELTVATAREFERVFGPEVEAHYVFNGTAANVLCLSQMLRPYQAAICAETAHLNLDECAAPERFLGSKLWTVPTVDGKITPDQCAQWLERMGDQHFAQPACVSLTQPTETGLVYDLPELREWRKFTRARNLMLHIDGARLANAAATLKVPLREITAEIGVDAVSFGGTKNGLMGAETVLLFTDSAKDGFRFQRKQAMQLPSKTRYLSAQFHAYLKNDLWLDIAQHTTGLAQDLKSRLSSIPELKLAFPVQSNALFVHIPKPWLKALRERCFFYIWKADSGLSRWMISWDWDMSLNEKWIHQLNEVKACLTVK